MSLRSALNALDRAPGPTPWFLTVGPDSRGPGAEFRWELREGTEWPSHALVAGDGSTRLLLGPGVYFQRLEGTRFLLWHADRPGPAASAYVLHLDANGLEPLPPDSAAGTSRRVVHDGGVVGTVEFPLDLEGRWEVEVRGAFEGADEVLLIARTREDSAHYVVFAVRPVEGQVEAFPQDWYNQSEELDKDWQWPYAVARDPESGRLCVRGIRMSSCLLDSTGRHAVSTI